MGKYFILYVTKVANGDREKLRLINFGFEYTGLNTDDGHPIMRKKAVGID